MELGGLQCHGCGSSNVVFDPKRRILTCNQCGKEEFYSRATLNANGKVQFSRENAINFFTEGKFENSLHFAMDVLNISKDNAPALYIMAYYDEFVRRKEGSLKCFFYEIKEIALEYDEVQDLKKLLLASAYNLVEYEKEAITLVAVNMEAEEDSADLCDFVDKLCPYIIKKRTSMDFLTNDLIEIYKELAGHCDIPKTCFALLKAIDENPDSPYTNDSFYLRSKAKYFYNNFILPIGKIINAMRTKELKDKFTNSYMKKKLKYEEDATLL
jgi:predicted nucleic-acid-binding Zn-ribbon protein